MKLAIMQPYFVPYIGYFQLMNIVDLFIIYDNIKYTKKGWINRNRMLQNGKDALFSLPLKNDSDFLNICEREISLNFERKKLLNKIKGSYSKAPFFKQTFNLFEEILNYNDINLFNFLYNSILIINNYLEINVKIKVSSTIDAEYSLKNQERVIFLCKAVNADMYINAIGGTFLYSEEAFEKNRIQLRFIKSKLFEYQQFNHMFCPQLSIIDVMMFNSVDKIKKYLDNEYELIKNT